MTRIISVIALFLSISFITASFGAPSAHAQVSTWHGLPYPKFTDGLAAFSLNATTVQGASVTVGALALNGVQKQIAPIVQLEAGLAGAQVSLGGVNYHVDREDGRTPP